MADINKIKVANTEYNIRDAVLTNAVSNLNSKLSLSIKTHVWYNKSAITLTKDPHTTTIDLIPKDNAALNTDIKDGYQFCGQSGFSIQGLVKPIVGIKQIATPDNANTQKTNVNDHILKLIIVTSHTANFTIGAGEITVTERYMKLNKV